MYKIVKIGENIFYLKGLGTFPPSVAKQFVKEFRKKTKNLPKFSVIVDGLHFIILNLKSFKIILKLLEKNNNRLEKSAYIIDKNPVLHREAQIMFEKAKSLKRKIVRNFDEAKEWLGIKEIILEKENID